MLLFVSAVVACVSGLTIMHKEMDKQDNSICLDIIFAVSLAYYLGGTVQ